MVTEEAHKKIKRRRRQKFTMRLHAGFAILLIVVLAIMVNYVSLRHYTRTDFNRTKYYGLSDKTKSLLESVTSRVDVVVFFQTDLEVYPDLKNVFKEYIYASPHMKVEYVDPSREPSRSEALQLQYGITEINVVIFDNGIRHKIVTSKDIYDFKLKGPKGNIEYFLHLK
jgi:hypothetical protein